MNPLTARLAWFWRSTALVGAVLLMTLASPPAAHAQSALYGCSRGGEYFSLDLTTGAGTLLGYLPFGATEIEYDPISGRAFAQSPDGSFFGTEFNPLNGAGIGSGVYDGGSYTGLEFVNGTLFGTTIYQPCGPSEFRHLDPWSGTSSYVGSTGLGPISGLAYDTTTSTMYGITGCSGGHSKLVRIDMGTGVATVIDSVAFEAGSLEFGPDGNLYAGGSFGGSGALYRIDPATGASVFVGYTGFPAVTGLMLGPTCHSTHSQIQLAGTFTSPPFSLPISPAMSPVTGCTWQVTTHLDPGIYLCKFVTDGALDAPSDYGDSLVGRILPGGPYPTLPVTGPGTEIRMQVLNPDDYTLTLDEGARTWSATAAGGTPPGSIFGSVDFELGFDFPPYPVATVDFFRGTTQIASLQTDRFNPGFSLTGLGPADYRVRVSAPSYAPAEVSPVTVGNDSGGVVVVHLTSLPSIYSRMDLVGGFNSFTIGANPMVQPFNSFWSTDQSLVTGSYGFKFATDGMLDTPPDYGSVTPFTFSIPASGDVQLGTGPSNVLEIRVDHPGQYHFNLDERNLTFQVFEIPPPPPPLPTIDINRIKMFISPAGSFAWDLSTGAAGLEFPQGSGKTAVFASGLWLSAGSLVALTEYSDEFQAGAMVGGAADNPNLPEYKVYKLNRVYASSAVRDSTLADYVAGAVPHGAPVVSVLPNGDLNIIGDQMLWHVYNDANPGIHTNRAGRTAPLGIEIQQTAFAFDQPGPLGNTVFMRFKLLNKGSNALSDMVIGVWSDPDLGTATDDLVGCDPIRGLGFCYNGSSPDGIYGSAPPAVGFDLLQGPLGPGTTGPLPMTAFIKYINGTDPDSAEKTIHYLHGLNADGTLIIDPTTSLPTTYMVSGNPVAGTGWLDDTPSDRRMLLCSGPIAMAPGDQQEIVIAILLGEGSDRLSSITSLKSSDDIVQQAFDANFGPPTAVNVSLVSSEAEPGRAHLVWHLSDHAEPVTVYRAESNLAWRVMGSISPDGTGRVEFEDTQVRAGARYGYRLGVRDGGSEVAAGEVWLDIPLALEFALQGLRPNPAVGDLWVSFSLPSAESASLELLDLGGRRVAAQSVGGLGAGSHRLSLGRASDVPPGVYMLRLRQGKRTLIAKAAIIR